MARTNTNILTAERARELFRYEPETGRLFWRRAAGGIPAGTEAGTTKFAHGNRYRGIQTGGRNYLAHRIAWLIVTGEWPKNQIDHIDGDGLNNKWSNLRDVTNVQNGRNQRVRSTNTSGVTGVHWYKPYQKWVAHICVDGRDKNLGYFAEFEDAVSVRKRAERESGFHENHGRKAA